MKPRDAGPLRLVVFAFDLPHPPNRGGRADMWRRLALFARHGVVIQLVCWCNSPDRGDQFTAARRALADVTEGIHIFPIRGGIVDAFLRMCLLPAAPSHATARRLTRGAYTKLRQQLRSFKPDAIWLEGPYPALSAIPIARDLGVPYFYRSHNVEHAYMARQARDALSMRDRVAWRIACVGLKRFEERVLRGARQIFDVSSDDVRFWNSRGFVNARQLLPIPEVAVIDSHWSTLGEVLRTRDVVFLGNLATPNNIRGIEFLIRSVIPRVLAVLPATKFTIAGSSPGAYARALAASCSSVELLADVPSAVELMRSARVLVNPVQSGGGVMLKIVDMLMTSSPIVSSSQGASGLPPEIRQQLRISDEAQSFAVMVVEELLRPSVDIAQRRLLQENLVRDATPQLIEELKRLARKANPTVVHDQSRE